MSILYKFNSLLLLLVAVGFLPKVLWSMHLENFLMLALNEGLDFTLHSRLTLRNSLSNMKFQSAVLQLFQVILIQGKRAKLKQKRKKLNS